MLCGVTTPEALLRVDHTILEAHHVFGRANDANTTMIVCRNCHAVLTEGQRASNTPLTARQSERERVIARALAAFNFVTQVFLPLFRIGTHALLALIRANLYDGPAVQRDALTRVLVLLDAAMGGDLGAFRELIGMLTSDPLAALIAQEGRHASR